MRIARGVASAVLALGCGGDGGNDPQPTPGGHIPASTNTSVGRTCPSAGTYAYTCTLHAGMNGTVVVH